MFIKKIELLNFRNYEYLNFEPNKKINLFTGRNAEGKTNILESISVLISGKSFKTSRDREIVKFEKEFYEINSLIEINGLEKDYHIHYEFGKQKKMSINLSNVNSLKELRRDNPIVVFLPEDLEIINKTPDLRRKYVDDLLGKTNLIYRSNLEKYKKILKEKNIQLKNRNKGLNVNLLFDAYNIRLASLGSYIIYERNLLMKELNQKLKLTHEKISDGKEDISINYQNVHKDKEIKTIEKDLYEDLNSSLEKDLFMKYSTVGPHRDDFLIDINDRVLKTYGSQGQKRSAVLSLKLTEIEIIKEKLKITPIFLLDDVFSELDIVRRKKLLESLSEMQSFITMTENKYLSEFKDLEKNIYNVKDNRAVLYNGGKNDGK